MPYALEPLVGGVLGEGTLIDPSVHPPRVEAVEYVLDAPTEDDLLESFPVYLVSDALGATLAEAGLSGFTLEPARVIPSREYTAVYGDAPHKTYQWLRPQPSPDPDCWVDDALRLCVSDRMMRIFGQGVLDGCDIVEI